MGSLVYKKTELAGSQSLDMQRTVRALVLGVTNGDYEKASKTYVDEQKLALKEMSGKNDNFVISIPGIEGVPTVDNYANALVGATFTSEANPLDVRLLLLAEKFLGVSEGRVEDSIKKVLDLSDIRSEQKIKMLSTLYELRQVVKTNDLIDVSYVQPDVVREEFKAELELKKEKIQFSQMGYLAVRGVEISNLQENGVEIITSENSFGMCAASMECRQNGDLGQDAGAIVETEDWVVLAEADGTGFSFYGELAAQKAVESVAMNTEGDLTETLHDAAVAILGVEKTKQIPNGFSGLIQGSFEKKRRGGSEAMFNLIKIDKKTGEVSGLFLGDGGFAVIRVNGDVGKFECGPKNSSSRLSSTKTMYGEPLSLDKVVSSPITLNKGDVIILFSDGLNEVAVKKCAEAITNGTEMAEIPKMIGEITNLRPYDDDDKVIMGYRH